MPRCAECDFVVDLSDPDHHVCADDGKGGFVKTTATVAAQAAADRVAGNQVALTADAAGAVSVKVTPVIQPAPEPLVTTSLPL